MLTVVLVVSLLLRPLNVLLAALVPSHLLRVQVYVTTVRLVTTTPVKVLRYVHPVLLGITVLPELLVVLSVVLALLLLKQEQCRVSNVSQAAIQMHTL